MRGVGGGLGGGDGVGGFVVEGGVVELGWGGGMEGCGMGTDRDGGLKEGGDEGEVMVELCLSFWRFYG